MKNFIEFLVAEGAVPGESLLRLLFEVTAGQPSEAELALRSGLLSPDDVLRAVLHQTRRHVDFGAACRELGLWSAPLAERVRGEFVLQNVEISRRLRDRDLLDEAKLAQLTERFLAQAAAAEPALAAAAGSEWPASAREPDRARIDHLLEVLSEETRIELVGAFAAIRDGASAAAAATASRLLHLFRGAARLAGSGVADMIAAELEGALAAPRADARALGENGLRSVDLLWDLRERLAEGGTEQAWWTRRGATCRELLSALWAAASPAATSAGPLRVLLIDDSRSVHGFVARILAETPHTLEHVYDGREGVARVLKGVGDGTAPDLILLDWEMPVLSGPEALRELRSRGVLIPVLMLTTRNSLEDIESMLVAGANEFVMKPFTDDILFEKAERALGRPVGKARSDAA